MNLKRIKAVIVARNREFYRDKVGLGWNLFMPFVMIIGFAFIFSGEEDAMFKVGVVSPAGQEAPLSEFLNAPHIKQVPIEDLEEGIDKVRYHRIDMLVKTGPEPAYWVNQDAPNGRVLEQLLRANYAAEPPPLEKQTVEGRRVRYVDWVLPGILGLNMMFSSLWGVGWVIVRYRKNGVLRRLRATPLSAMEFLTAQIISRLLVVSTAVTIVFIGTDLMLDFPMRGSYLALILLFMAGSVCMISVGLMVAARLRTEEVADGLLNLISWPMMIGSGVWFSMEGTHPVAQWGSQLMPLTHIVDGARAIMLDGAGLMETLPWIFGLLGSGVLMLVFAARVFRWQ